MGSSPFSYSCISLFLSLHSTPHQHVAILFLPFLPPFFFLLPLPLLLLQLLLPYFCRNGERYIYEPHRFTQYTTLQRGKTFSSDSAFQIKQWTVRTDETALSNHATEREIVLGEGGWNGYHGSSRVGPAYVYNVGSQFILVVGPVFGLKSGRNMGLLCINT